MRLCLAFLACGTISVSTHPSSQEVSSEIRHQVLNAMDAALDAHQGFHGKFQGVDVHSEVDVSDKAIDEHNLQVNSTLSMTYHFGKDRVLDGDGIGVGGGVERGCDDVSDVASCNRTEASVDLLNGMGASGTPKLKVVEDVQREAGAEDLKMNVIGRKSSDTIVESEGRVEDGDIQKSVVKDGDIQKSVVKDGDIQKSVGKDGDIQKSVNDTRGAVVSRGFIENSSTGIHNGINVVEGDTLSKRLAIEEVRNLGMSRTTNGTEIGELNDLREKEERNPLGQDRLEKQRLEHIEKERLEQIEKERLEVHEKERLELLEKERLEQIEKERLELLEKERLGLLEKERLELLEKERLELLEKERLELLEKERLKRQENDRLERLENDRLERLEKERLERLEKERIERIEKERIERLEKERLQRLENDRVERLENERIERLEKERQELENREREEIERKIHKIHSKENELKLREEEEQVRRLVEGNERRQLEAERLSLENKVAALGGDRKLPANDMTSNLDGRLASVTGLYADEKEKFKARTGMTASHKMTESIPDSDTTLNGVDGQPQEGQGLGSEDRAKRNHDFKADPKKNKRASKNLLKSGIVPNEVDTTVNIQDDHTLVYPTKQPPWSGNWFGGWLESPTFKQERNLRGQTKEEKLESNNNWALFVIMFPIGVSLVIIGLFVAV